MMRKILLLLLGALMLGSCLRTKTETEEDRINKAIADSIHRDSLERARNTPDTTIATFKRTVFCDGKQQVTFDRVMMLSGSEAEEYAQRHKHFGNNTNMVVNYDVTLETLPMDSAAVVLLLKPGDDAADGAKSLVESDISDIEELPKESVVQLVLLHRSIVYFRELDYANN
ncbi:MAG: hypothetical protein MJZ61_05710 [Bacteroidales bacterium]|nr:hypothetical protein [Bacteroidales bacterium]